MLRAARSPATLAVLLAASALLASAPAARAHHPPIPPMPGAIGEPAAPIAGGPEAAPPVDLPPLPAPARTPPPVAIEPPAELALPAPVTAGHVPGGVARLRTDGRAAIPRAAPRRVRALIARYNRIVGRPYKWGGGHARLEDSGYDCSGAVGYGLIRAGMLGAPLVSGAFARWGAAGAGRWVTVYAHPRHVYLEVAGLRLDTSTYGERGGRRGVRWRAATGARPGYARRHPAGL